MSHHSWEQMSLGKGPAEGGGAEQWDALEREENQSTFALVKWDTHLDTQRGLAARCYCTMDLTMTSCSCFYQRAFM